MTDKLEQYPNISEAFFAYSNANPAKVAYSVPQRENRSTWKGVSFAELRSRVAALSNYLRNMGFKPGEMAAIVSNTRPEWMEADLAILVSEGVSVSIYHSLPA